MGFTGFPLEALTFYERLEAENSKAFWTEHRDEFVDLVRRPMEALCAELDDYGPFHLFRPHNDLRFSRSKPPYKTHQGAYGELDGGSGYYVQLSATGLMVGGGYYAMARDQLERFREAVDADDTGPEISAVVEALARTYRIGAIDELRTAPRGYPRDHPRVELLRRKGLMASKEFGAPAWIHTRKVVSRVRAMWSDVAPMNAWLDAHVGPSTLPPPEFG
ncbi:MAG: DUF2461 domain-containing protein [Acidimicrobiales bacterium]